MLWFNFFFVKITDSGSNGDIPQQLGQKEYAEGGGKCKFNVTDM